ncbi:glycosylated lysosomal membrane protein [Trichomycterus rosablanca]|uniref:glycosylated lysosomal membrane protein n=1 Tax=Trichomycterus rosablanca TaxID=2290929 RepID=UPI002F35DDE1
MVPSLPHMKVLLFLFLFLFFYLSDGVNGFLWSKESYRRKVSLELNPGLDPGTVLPPGVSLLHARALGTDDTLHFVLCSGGAPALLLVHTDSNHSVLNVNWTAYISKHNVASVKVLPESTVQYSSALVLTRLWEFDERNQSDVKVLPPYQLQDFSWDDMNRTINHTHLTAQLCGTHTISNTSACIQFSGYESGGRERAWPSLLHNANSSQLRVVLSGVKPRTNQSRLALELQVVTGAELRSRVDVHRSIDDEHTPSIFKVSEWVWSGDNSSSSSSLVGYSQWKPVAYRKNIPAIEDACPCSNSEPVPLPRPPTTPIISAFFTHNPHTYGLNVSFHTVDEEGSDAVQFISWTVLAGIGTPPADFFSPLVMSIMAVGLGTPLVLFVLGGVYICIRKLRRDLSSSYQRIN